MRIQKIIFKNNNVFTDLELDFTDATGNVVNTIILAGENGVGKTYLLKAIFDFCTNNLHLYGRDEIRIFELQLTDQELQILKSTRLFISRPDTEPVLNKLTVTIQKG